MQVDIEKKILWCSIQKRGIRLVQPNDDLCNAYKKKSNDSLKAINVNSDAGLRDWAMDAAYYARYHALYALLQKCGIRSEIHDCSISLARLLFKIHFTDDMLKEIEKAKTQRINSVYYTNRTVTEEEASKNYYSAPEFVIRIEKVISEITPDEISGIREKLKTVMSR